MTTWLKIFDASGSWPSDAAACYSDGFRVVAGYGGSSSWKNFTAAMRDTWRGAGFGVAAMYESTIDRALSGGYSGGQADAHAARTYWRNLGMPDDASIAYAVDTNVGSADHAALKAYFQGVNSVDTAKPLAYIEDDIGELLVNDGLIIGIFTPAAYAWNDPAVLYTPSNAPAHVLWTQEHNGVALHGGDVDTGHIVTTANYWKSEADMALTNADGVTVLSTDIVPNPSFRYDSPDHIPTPTNPNPTTQAAFALGDMWQRIGDSQAAVAAVKTELDQVKAQAAANGSGITTLSGKVDALASVVAAIPTTAAPAAPIDYNALATALAPIVHAELAKLGVTVDVAP